MIFNLKIIILTIYWIDIRWHSKIKQIGNFDDKKSLKYEENIKNRLYYQKVSQIDHPVALCIDMAGEHGHAYHKKIRSNSFFCDLPVFLLQITQV